MAANIVRATAFQTFFNQEVLNVYFYECNGVPSTAEINAFSSVFADAVLADARQAQHNSLRYSRVLVELVDTGYQYDLSYDVPGTYPSTEPTAPFYAYGVKLFRTDNSTRHGFKRLAGVPEDNNTANIIQGIETPAALEDYLTSLAVTLTLGFGLAEFQPVIIGKNNSNDVADWTANPIVSAAFTKITSQNTRKIPG